MELSTMRYGEFQWPHNPRIYSMEYERVMATNKVPFGQYFLQDLGRTRRVMRGEGEFVGESAHLQFGQLANAFYKGGANMLVHPLWMNAMVYFVDLKVEQVPRPNYVKYAFTFWEATDFYQEEITIVEEVVDSGTDSGLLLGATTVSSHTVLSGQTLWGIANLYGMSLGDLLALNTQIKNPNLIYPGDEVYLS